MRSLVNADSKCPTPMVWTALGFVAAPVAAAQHGRAHLPISIWAVLTAVAGSAAFYACLALYHRLYRPKLREFLGLYRKCARSVFDLKEMQTRRVFRDLNLQKELSLRPLDEQWQALRTALAQAGVPAQRLDAREQFYEDLIVRLRHSVHCYSFGEALSEELRALRGASQVRLPLSEPVGPRLPEFLTPLVGRQSAVDAVIRLLAQHPDPTPADGGDHPRLLVLVGPGGVGKTRLAVEAAKQLDPQFPDHSWFVDLESATTRSELFRRIASGFGLRQPGGRTEEEWVLEFLQSRELLLVLDNIEQVSDGPAAVQALLASCPKVKCLLSSREKFELEGAPLWRVDPLETPPERAVDLDDLVKFASVRLFRVLARQQKAGFEVTKEHAADVAALCQQLEGVPLAILLAAAHADSMMPGEILAGIQRQPDLLGAGYQNLPERQQTMRASINWSHSRLTPQERRCFARLGVFTGTFTREAAAEVCDESAMGSLLGRLYARSLLTCSESGSGSRYGMLKVIRAYAREKLPDQPDAQQTGERHADYFRRYASERIQRVRRPDEAVALRDLDLDADNLRSAMDWCVREGRHAWAAELGLALGRFLPLYGLPQEALQRVDTALAGLEGQPDTEVPLQAQLLQEQAGLYLDWGDWSKAGASASDALHLYEKRRDDRGKAEAQIVLGLAARGREARDEARRLFELALTAFHQLGDQVGLANVHTNLGVLEYEDPHGSKDGAAEHWRTALKLRTEVGDQRGMAEARTNLGVFAMDQNQLEEARSHYDQALSIENALGDRQGIGRALANLGELAEKNADLSTAYRLSTAAVYLLDEVGSADCHQAEELRDRIIRARSQPEETMPDNLRGAPLEEITTWALNRADDGRSSAEAAAAS